MEKKLFSFLLTGEQIERLKAISERTLIPQSALARRGIDLVLAEYEEETVRPKKAKKERR
jgi:predicted DNA-binding protein